ncbi:MAG: N-acetylneuraminate synthase family protein [Phycisphaerales bacterium JB063]
MAATHVHIIAEVGSVHDGSFGNALKLIELAAQCGADSVKFQTHLPEHETLREAPSPAYFNSEPRYDYFQRTGFSPDQWAKLKRHADTHHIGFLSSPFSAAAVDLLETVGVPCYKIPSGEVTNLPLLERVAQTGKPVLLSSGMSSWAELDAAAAVFTGSAEAGELTVMQCSSAYPCPPERVGLNVMREMAERYGRPVGLSDHTPDAFSSFAAVAQGAVVIEKHLTFSRAMYGSDAALALEPAEFSYLVQGVRAIETMMQHEVDKDDLTPYREMKAVFEKSIVARRPIPAGATITRDMLDVRKPGTGIPARDIGQVVGKVAAHGISADSLVTPEDLR